MAREAGNAALVAGAQIERSIRAYAKAHRDYERNHGEIFNPVEQERLRSTLEFALDAVLTSPSNHRRVLDFGCGSGNLTAHFVDLGLHVTAADVSPQFLRAIERRYGTGREVETLRLNGTDLAGVPEASFDLVSAYSVLHHVPDYLGAVDELCRVVKPGGVVYLDHEVSDAYWDPHGCVSAFRRELEEASRDAGWWNPRHKRWQRFLMPEKYLWGLRKLRDPRFQPEGDVHVWPDDHVEWARVEERLEAGSLDILLREDYLLYKQGYPRDVYERYEERCGDMTVLIARRRA